MTLTVLLAALLWGLSGNTEETAVCGNSALWWWWKATAFGEDFDHGRLIPFVCGYLVWLRRKELATVVVGPDGHGLWIAMAAMLVYWLGVQGQQVQIALYALWVMVCAAVLGFWGKEVFRIVRFPLAYLFLAFPLSFLYPLTFPLRMASTGLAVGLLNGIGIAVVRNGTALHDAAGVFHLEVADPCSGLRSVFALVALTAVYAYLTLRRYKRWMLVALVVPLAICANAVRITMVGVVARFYGQERATGFYHDFSGYVFFICATLLVLAMAWLLGKLPDRKSGEVSAERDSTAAQENAGNASGAQIARREWLPVLGVPAVMAAGAIWVLVRPPLNVSDQLPIVANLPANLGSYVGEQVYYCQNENCLKSVPESAGARTSRCPVCGGDLDIVALAERRGLPADTKMAKRVYRSEQGPVFSVNAVIAGEDRRSIHRPEHCLPGQGLAVERIRKERVNLLNGYGLNVAIITARRTASDDRIGFAYWFVSPDRETASTMERHFWAAYDRLLRNTASRWVYVSVFSPESFDTPAAMEELRRFLSLLHPALKPGREP